MNSSNSHHLSITPFFEPRKVGAVRRVPYQQRAEEARQWAEKYEILPAFEDRTRIYLLIIDAQNTFCLPMQHSNALQKWE